MLQQFVLSLQPVIESLNVWQFFLYTVGSFFILYWFFTSLAYFIFVHRKSFPIYQKKAYRSHQIKTEMKRSMVSIVMFGLLAFPMYYGLQSGFLKIIYEFSWPVFLIETFALFIWNDVHFYLIHRTFHFKPFYKWHADHHYSHVPSPFSAYSFHWSEGLLLGAVMPLIMCFYNFQLMSLAMLPLMSIVLNVLGHSNVDFFHGKPMQSIFSFSKRHSQHHKIPHSNYGFFLPYFDILFGTIDPQETET